MPGQVSKSEANVVYSGSPLTEAQEQEAADTAAQAKADYIAGLGKGVLSNEGIIIHA